MKQQTFEKLYSDNWQELDSLLEQCEKRHFTRNNHRDGRLPQMYRRVCHHLSLAQERRYSSYLVDRLNDLVLRSHQQLYRRQTRFIYQLVQFILVTFPVRVRENINYFWIATAIFYGPTLIMYALTLLQPDLIYHLLGHSQVGEFESMYDPTSEDVGEDRDARSDMMMFGHYIQNNISIGFQTFATGLFLGLGSIFYLSYNGIYFGAIAGHIVNIGYHNTFFPFVIGHGSFELTAIVIAGMGGLMLGHALVSPKQQTRLDALKTTGLKALDLLYGIIFFLTIAAFIEAFWSSNSALPLAVKYGVGTALWALVLGYLAFSGRGAPKLEDK